MHQESGNLYLSVYTVGSMYRIFGGLPSFFDHGTPLTAMVILYFYLQQGILSYNHPEFQITFIWGTSQPDSLPKLISCSKQADLPRCTPIMPHKKIELEKSHCKQQEKPKVCVMNLAEEITPVFSRRRQIMPASKINVNKFSSDGSSGELCCILWERETLSLLLLGTLWRALPGSSWMLSCSEKHLETEVGVGDRFQCNFSCLPT